MRLSHLSLTHFRNYASLELELSTPLTLLQGANAQGKTNLLEAVYFLATSKPVHAQTEREIIDWQAQEEPIPYCRVAAQVQEHDGSRQLDLEILLTPRENGGGFKKQVRVNGVNKRSMDLIGLLRAVLFLPEDIKLVDGAPGERRRYLDIALCQIDRTYCRALSAYQKVLAQRNSLLRNLREQGISVQTQGADSQLAFWDERLVQHGSIVVARRSNFLLQLEAYAAGRHASLTDGGERFGLCYLPSFNPGHLAEREFVQLKDARPDLPLPTYIAAELTATGVTEAYLAKLRSRRDRELAAGGTLYGPHRDDVRLFTDGRDLRLFGSRGQQRTAALSLKLAEVQAMTEATGSPPLLLLDDVMSELDAQRRSTLLAALAEVDQVLVTTTDWDDFTPEFRARAQRFHVQSGTVLPTSS